MLSKVLGGLSLVALVAAAPAPRPIPLNVAADPISGSWDLMFLVEGHPTPATMELKLKGHAVTGKISSEHTGPGKVTDGTWKADTLAFTAVFEEHESIALNATLQNGKLVGEFRTEGFSAKWEATKR
jgi:hypothetical protein